MQHSIQGRIRAFLPWEEGRVSAKAPLTLGVAMGSLLLAQVMRPAAGDAYWVVMRRTHAPRRSLN